MCILYIPKYLIYNNILPLNLSLYKYISYYYYYYYVTNLGNRVSLSIKSELMDGF